MVGENGAFYMRYDAARRTLVRRFAVDEPTRRGAPRRGSRPSREQILREVPGCALASDQHYRETDLAIDFCEDVPPLPRAAVDRIVALMEAEGLTAKVSSIHVNGWFGGYDKLTMTRTLARRGVRHRYRCGRASTSCSPATRRTTRRCSRSFRMPSAWPTCARSLDRIATLPAYVTKAEAGAGFAELADFLLA